jgi:amidophosphoribosyltransferase
MEATRQIHPGRPELREHCALFAIWNIPKAAELTYLGLYSLQHRGQESAGISSWDGKKQHLFRGMGLVADVFDDTALSELPGKFTIGHTRYSTTGSTHISNAQPLMVNFSKGQMSIAHNGNLVNSTKVRAMLEKKGSIFQSSMDTEVIVHLIATSGKKEMIDAIVEALKTIKGAYSLLLLVNDDLYAIRDPRGFRPLSIGKLGEGFVVSSESCGFDIVGASYLRDVKPGEVVRFTKDGLKSFEPFEAVPARMCVFEYVYFSRPDSKVFGASAGEARREFGRQLAREHPVEADCVISVPDSSNFTALGYSEESEIPMELGLIRNHYVGRTFIRPTQKVRDLGVKIKYNTVRTNLEGRSIIVVDDSIIRGTTSRVLVRLLRQAGAREVHFRIGSPPFKFPCYYGIDTPSYEELIASKYSIQEIASYLEVDSIGYLSLEGMLKSAPLAEDAFCHACFSGDYSVEVEETDKFIHERKHVLTP